ncbi:MAG TPA: hypothetical protein VMS76_07460 [Planctomycetota bacterium]|nr:hypothetical protein [Planctomycetota bacterium]
MKGALLAFLAAVVIAGAGAGGFFAARRWVTPEPVPRPEADRAEATPTYARRAMVAPAAVGQGPTMTVLGAPKSSRWAETNARAIEALGRGELELAVELFESCVEAQPAEPVFAHNLAEALARQALRDHEVLRPCVGCLELLERALELAPEREDLAALLERWRREAEAEKDFWRDSSLHFDLAYDGFQTDLLRGSPEILNELELAYTDLTEHFGVRPVDDGRPRISVVFYRREGFQGITGLGDWAGGAFDGTVRVPVEDLALERERLRRVLRHELVHAFVRHAGGLGVPGWLNEGLAQWLEGDAKAGVRAAQRQLAGRELFSLDTLQGSLITWKDEAEIGVAYAQSLALCDHVARRYGEGVLFAMVEGCKRGEAPAATFQRWTGLDLAVALRDLAEELAGR